MGAALILSSSQHEELTRVLAKYRSVGKFYAFGSRVRGGARSFSDLDLLIRGEGPVRLRVLGAIEQDFSESRLPFRVDLVDAGRASASFLAAIAAEALEI